MLAITRFSLVFDMTGFLSLWERDVAIYIEERARAVTVMLFGKSFY